MPASSCSFENAVSIQSRPTGLQTLLAFALSCSLQINAASPPALSAKPAASDVPTRETTGSARQRARFAANSVTTKFGALSQPQARVGRKYFTSFAALKISVATSNKGLLSNRQANKGRSRWEPENVTHCSVQFFVRKNSLHVLEASKTTSIVCALVGVQLSHQSY